MAYGTPGIQTHEQWLGLVQPVGLVVAPAVLTKLELFPNQGAAYLSSRQRQLKSLLEERDQSTTGKPIQVVPSFQLLATQLLDWGDGDLIAAHALNTVPEVVLSEYGETLRPTHAVPKFEGEGLQALVLDLTELNEWGREFDEAWNPTGHGWDATPQQRFERLLKETEHPIGILFNGSALRLVHAPRGESSGWLTIPLEPMAEVAGRPMLGALELLLGVDRLFGGSPEQRLPALLTASRKNQNEVSTRLAEQVLEALWELLLGFDEAERVAQDAGRTIIGDLAKSEEGQKHLYGGMITVLLRLVFLLYAEDEALMPTDSLYGQHYSVNALADRLRQERFEHQSGMADRRGAWASLLSLFRLVYDGGGADPNYLPARHGELFDPDAYPFLEGRGAECSYADGILTNLPAVSDDVVEKVLSRLLWLADDSKVAQRLSYRSLDVEQIGSVYEGIMGFTVEQATGSSVGITYRPPRQKITITVVVDAEQLLAQSGSKREKWLDEQAGVKLKLPAGVKRDLQTASNLVELCLALDKKLSPHTPLGLQKGSLILQPTAERRRSGSHYTPRALTEPIVAEAFRPWLERCNHQPTAEQILALKVCDPAMGSGAFLVAVCRFLAGWLVEAWERDGYPDDFREEWDKDIVARRRIAQSCVYGVDKNPFAVNLAKLSLWLVTLSKELPFTFVDHSLKCGDSLVGYSVKEIRAAMSEVQLGFLDAQNRIYEQMGIDRRESFAFDSLSDTDYDSKKQRLDEQIKATEGLRQAGDLMVAAFFAKTKPKERADKQQVYLAMLSGTFQDDALAASVQEIREQLAAGEKGVTPFHWDLEFPEVFGEGRDGFDVFVGNPPFLGGRKISTYFGLPYFSYLSENYLPARDTCDICSYFLRGSYDLLRISGTMGMIGTQTISRGESREGGLAKIRDQGGWIYCAKSRMTWPGAASVVVATVHISKRSKEVQPILNDSQVQLITAFLFQGGPDHSPEKIRESGDLVTLGSVIYGSGFLFDNSDPLANSLDTMKEIICQSPKESERIKPYIGGDEFNKSPTHQPNRYAINLSNLKTEADLLEYPLLRRLVEQRVKPLRMSLGDNPVNKPLKKRWWAYQAHRPTFYERIKSLSRVIASSKTSTILSFDFIGGENIYSDKLVLFGFESALMLAVLSCQIHEIWVWSFCPRQGSGSAYSIADGYESFPFPTNDFELRLGDLASTKDFQQLYEISERFQQFRAELMVSNNEGLTSTYNRFHDPAETNSGLLQLRALHQEMDQAVLAAYGWSDVLNQAMADNPHHTPCGFDLDYLDLEDDLQLPEALQERIDEGHLFFWDAGDALDFQGQLQAYGAITGRRKLPWRYRWPDAVRDDVLARLLALNAERYAEEVALGLHSKGAKKPTGKARGRKPKSSGAQQSDFQLEAEPYQAGLNLGL